MYSTRYASSASNREDIPEKTRKHLFNVYSTLGAGVGTAFLGAMYSMSTFNFVGTGLPSFLLSMGLLIWLQMSRPTNAKEKSYARFFGFLAFTGLQGASIAPLLLMADITDGGIIPMALGITFALFAAVSVTALTSRRRSYLWIGSILSSILTISFWYSIIGYFVGFPRPPAFLYLYASMMLGYILVDTQRIVETVSNPNSGYADVISHALNFFVHLFGLFVRVLIIIMKNKQRDSRNNSKKNKRRG